MPKKSASSWMLATLTLGLVTLTFLPQAKALSPDDIAKMAKSVPAQVPQVLTGGEWNDGEKTGLYRTIVVATGKGDKTAVDVFIQWIEGSHGTNDLKIVSTVPIKEVRQEKLSNAFVYLEGDKAGEITIVITSYDPTLDKDTQIWLNATTPGKYAVMDPTTSDTDQEN